MVINPQLKTYTDREVLMALRVATRGISVRKAAESFGVSGAYVHDILHMRRGISENIAKRLGFTLVPPAPIVRRWKRVQVTKKVNQKVQL